MRNPTTPDRRAIYLRTLAETGNQRVAAMAARVSHDWARPRRRSDPAFAAAYDAAMAAAMERLSHGNAVEEARTGASGLMTLSDGTRFSAEGEELVIRRGRRDGKSRLVRAKMKQWTPRLEARFLEVLAASCSIKMACRAVGMSYTAAYLHRQRRSRFAKRWREAEDIGHVKLEFALIEGAARLFGEISPDYGLPLMPMDVDSALHLAQMKQHRNSETHRKPGRPYSHQMPLSPAESRAEMLRAVDVVIRARQIGLTKADADV